MARAWVTDASPLILLGKIEHIDLLEQLCQRLIIPRAVADEVQRGPVTDPARLWLAEQESIQIASVPVSPTVSEWALGAGESAVISYAFQNRRFEVVLDDAAARTCAQALGLKVRGTLGVLVLAKRDGLIQNVRPALDALKDAGLRVDDGLVRKVLALAGEL